jgi:peptide deformylase
VIRPILHYPHPTLLEYAQPVTEITPELTQLATDMIETMYAYGGIGLSAPQVGVSVRLIIVRSEKPNDFPAIVFNPVITHHEGSTITKEGCLSVPRVYDWVKRSRTITVEGLAITGDPFQETVTGLQAVIYQHEVDHLNGVEFLDHLTPGKRLLALKNSAKYRTFTK